MNRPNQSKNFIWSIQNKDFLRQKGFILTCSKKNTPPNWRYAYQWMEEKYYEKIGVNPSRALIWIWIQKEYVESKFYYTVTQLYPSYYHDLKNKVAIILEMPANIILISSYNKWSTLVDYCQTFKRKPESNKDWDGIFDVRRLNMADHKQGVVPFIKRHYIIGTIELEMSKLKKFGADFRKK